MTTDFLFRADIDNEFVAFSVFRKKRLFRSELVLPCDQWAENLTDNQKIMQDELESLCEAYQGTKTENSVSLPHRALIGLTDSQAMILGLPPAIPFALDLKTHGIMTDDDFFISTNWVTSGGVSQMVTRRGAFVYKGSGTYRLPSPLYEIAEAASVLAHPAKMNREERFKALATLNELLPPQNENSNVYTDFGSIRILHASAFSLQVPSLSDAFHFDPILFSRKAIKCAEDGGRILDEEENLLTPDLQSRFASDRFKRWKEIRDCYAVEDGIYVYIDPDLKKALGVVRQYQDEPFEKRREFLKSPQKYLREELGSIYDDDDVLSLLFVETEQYAQNVKGLGLWAPPIIPWLIKKPNSWLPEKFGVKIGKDYVQLEPEHVPNLAQDLQLRLDIGSIEPVVYRNHQGEFSIPITKENADIFSNIARYIEKTESNGKSTEASNANAEKVFLEVFDNIHELQNDATITERAKSSEYVLPSVLKTNLKKHQVEGVSWLIDAWSQGAPGVLLADDMGLGKTLQALTFLAWLRERKSDKMPLLIVAPTGLLNNWQREIDTHLQTPYLGGLCKAYGRFLSEIRDSKGQDISGGKIHLGRDKLRNSDVVLTTYETYRDYHHSFGGVRFSAAVFDECQKIKNPKSQVNKALESVNADFRIAMTGTPIENAMEDLWAILNQAWPGFLGSLKDFSSSYNQNNPDKLEKLNARLKAPATEAISAPILWRRMKDNILQDLPTKTLHTAQVMMPSVQAEAYSQIVARAKSPNPPSMLQTLHGLRGVSLHPIEPSSILGNCDAQKYDQYVRDSARLQTAMNILSQIQKKQEEKALLFIETINMQHLMAAILKRYYGLSKLPFIINGNTGVDKIQDYVDNFQKDSGFDVMILSPKVGGVGLTLTAANHVIHLSRWWNPAVEDQSTDRVYRLGQKRDVHVYYPVAVHPDIGSDSFDLKLHDLLERKRQLSRDMLLPIDDESDIGAIYRDVVR